MAILKFRGIYREDFEQLEVKDPDTRYLVLNPDGSVYGEYIGDKLIEAKETTTRLDGEIARVEQELDAAVEKGKSLSTNAVNDDPRITFENEVLYQERKRGWEVIGEVPVYLRKYEIGTNRIQGSAIVGDEIFWIGGSLVTALSSSPLIGATNKNISYNLRTNAWKENPDLPISKDTPTLVAVGTDIYILGSMGRTGKLRPYETVFAPDYRYDTITGTYEELNSLQDENYLYVSVQSSGADHLDGKIYISGRYWHRKDKSTGEISLLTEPRLAIYDIATDTWTLGPTPPMSNDGGSSKILDRKFYVYRNTFHYYDIDTETWSEPLNVSGIESRSHTTMAVRDGRIYVIGGFISGSSPRKMSGKTYVYDPVLNEWEEDVDLLVNNEYGIGIGYLMSVVWNGRLVVYGGTGLDETIIDNIDDIENQFPNWYVFIERFRNERDLTIILDKAKDYTYSKPEIDAQVALKVDTSDIVNNLTSTDTDKPLSANQGKVLNDTKANKTQEAWIAPTLLNSWVDTPGKQTRYKKDSMGVVWVEMFVEGGALNNNIFVLPTGYRPGQALNFVGIATGGGYSNVGIGADGSVVFASGNTSGAQRFAFSFRASEE